MPVQVRKAGSNCEDNIQLWRGITKTEYPDPSDTGCLQAAVSYLTEVYAQVWEELERIPEQRNVSMKQNT